MPEKSKSKSTSSTTPKNKLEEKINKIEKRLKKEILERKIISDSFGKSIEEQKRFLIMLSEREQTNLAEEQVDLEEKIVKVEKIKDDILGYTLQIITIVIGILALIFTLTFISLSGNDISNYIDNYGKWIIILFVALVFILIIWCILWFKKESGCFKKSKLSDKNNIINSSELKNRKNILIGVLIGAFFGLIASFTSGYYFWSREYPSDQWLFWFCFIVLIIVILYCFGTIYILGKKENK